MFIKTCFEYFGLNYKNHIKLNEDLFRPTDILVSRGDPTKASKNLNWKAKTDVFGVIEKMIEYKLNKKNHT